MVSASQHQLAELIRALGTVRMTHQTALRLAGSAGSIEHFTMGANAHGKCAELIAMSVRNSLTDPVSPWVVVNAPSVPSNYVRAWLNPDSTSARDLLYEVRISDTRHIFVPGAQVKVGEPGYIARSLLSHAHDPRYAKICDIDARLVCPDGSPRIAADAFTKGQAAALNNSGFKFVGIKHLEQDSKRVHAGLKGIQEHECIAHERELIIRANYAPRQVALRAGYAGGITFLVIAGAASYQQYSYYKRAVKEGKLEDNPEIRKEFTKQAAKTVAKQAAIGGGMVAAGATVEAGAFHVAENFMPATKARIVASSVVSVGYAGMDAMDEYIAYRSGEISKAEAITYGAIKAILDGLPIAGQAWAGSGGAVVGMGVATVLKWLLGAIRQKLSTPLEPAQYAIVPAEVRFV